MSTLVCAEEGATGAYSYDAPTLRHSGTQGAPYLHRSRPRWCMERRRLHLGYRSHSDCPRCRSLWGEQDRHRRCEHPRLVSTPNDRQSNPSTVGTSHDASWTRQPWINAALSRRSWSCMERSCVRSHHSGHRCYNARHLVRPRRVNPARKARASNLVRLMLRRDGTAGCFSLVEPRAARLEFARPRSENAHETYKFPELRPTVHTKLNRSTSRSHELPMGPCPPWCESACSKTHHRRAVRTHRAYPHAIPQTHEND